jgi:hypothetical protein
MLPNRVRVGAGWQPPLPLILASLYKSVLSAKILAAYLFQRARTDKEAMLSGSFSVQRHAVSPGRDGVQHSCRARLSRDVGFSLSLGRNRDAPCDPTDTVERKRDAGRRRRGAEPLSPRKFGLSSGP